MAPATDTLAALFPGAASFELGCPQEHGGSQVALLVREGLPAACRAQAPVALCSVHGGWCQLATAAPASEDERLLLNSYATELEWQLNAMLKETEEVRRLVVAVERQRGRGMHPLLYTPSAVPLHMAVPQAAPLPGSACSLGAASSG